MPVPDFPKPLKYSYVPGRACSPRAFPLEPQFVKVVALDTVKQLVVLCSLEGPMFTETVYTIEEISQHLRVPPDAILKEVGSGRLRAVRLGEHLRICESDFNSFLRSDFEAADGNPLTAAVVGSGIKTPQALEVSPTEPFDHTWPARKGAARTTEHFMEAREGIVSDRGRERHVKLGFTSRKSAGKLRRRCLVLVDRYPTVEFVAADEKPNGRMASIIKNRNGKQLPIGATLPPEYKDLPVEPYNELIKGPRASSGLAVVCDSRDFASMIEHALIRYRFREARALTKRAHRMKT